MRNKELIDDSDLTDSQLEQYYNDYQDSITELEGMFEELNRSAQSFITYTESHRNLKSQLADYAQSNYEDFSFLKQSNRYLTLAKNIVNIANSHFK